MNSPTNLMRISFPAFDKYFKDKWLMRFQILSFINQKIFFFFPMMDGRPKYLPMPILSPRWVEMLCLWGHGVLELKKISWLLKVDDLARGFPISIQNRLHDIRPTGSPFTNTKYWTDWIHRWVHASYFSWKPIFLIRQMK